MIGLTLITSVAMSQQVLTMQEIQSAIQTNHPALKCWMPKPVLWMKKGAYSWMPPEVGAGFSDSLWSSRWKYMNGQPGMGAFMISTQQMFPNKKGRMLNLPTWMQSSVELQKRCDSKWTVVYKKNYYDWIVLEKKLKVLDENDKLLKFMMQSAEIGIKRAGKNQCLL